MSEKAPVQFDGIKEISHRGLEKFLAKPSEAFLVKIKLMKSHREKLRRTEKAVKETELLVMDQQLESLSEKDGIKKKYKENLRMAREEKLEVNDLHQYYYGENKTYAVFREKEQIWRGNFDKKYEQKSEKIEYKSYVLAQQKEDLKVKWEVLVEDRVGETLGIMGVLKGEDKEQQEKIVEVSGKTRNFFQNEEAEILKISQETDSKSPKKAEMLKAFEMQVFGSVAAENKVAVAKLFQDVWSDFVGWKEEEQTIMDLNDVMVENVDQSEEQWQKAVFQEAQKKEAEYVAQAALVKVPAAETPLATNLIQPTDLEVQNHFDTFVNFADVERRPGGGYEVVIKGTESQKLELPVKILKDPKSGEFVYHFMDTNADHAQDVVSRGQDVVKELRSRFVDFLMNVTLKQKLVYAGPRLNDYLNDKDMTQLAEAIFGFSFENGSRTVSQQHINRFLRMAQILTRNESLTGERGSMESLAKRVLTLKDVLLRAGAEPNMNADEVVRLRRVLDKPEAKDYSLSELFKQAGIEGKLK